MCKGRWHGAAVTEGSIRLDVLTKPGSTGTLGRSLSQPAADSSLYAREPAPFAAGNPQPSPAWRGQGIFPSEGTEWGNYRLLVMLPIGYFSRGFFHRLLLSCGKGLWGRAYPQKYSTALLQAVEKFSRFSRRLRWQGRGERRSICVIWFLFVLYSSLSTVISWFSTKFIHSCGYSCG